MELLFLFMVITVLALLFYFFKRSRTCFFAKNSIDADAIILNMQLTGVCVNNELQAIIQLQVQPERGKSFVTDIKNMLSATDYTQVQPGTRIRVKYNPGNHKDIQLLKDTFAWNNKTKTPGAPLV